MTGMPFMPLFVDDYEAATAHLNLMEDGAYSRLLRLCWRSPGCKIPNDMDWIFRKVRAVTDLEKQAVSDVLAEFFTTGRGKIWSKRLLSIHLQKWDSYQNKSKAVEKARAAKALKKQNKDDTKTEAKQDCFPSQPEPEPEPEPEKESDDDDGAREGVFSIISELVGWPRGLTEKDRVTYGKWRNAGLTDSEITATIRETMERKTDGRPPSALSYFSQPMADLVAAKADTSLPAPNPNHAPIPTDLDAVFNLAKKRGSR